MKQESYLDWALDENDCFYILTNATAPIASAFTVAELGEILPTFCELEGVNRVFNCWKEPQGWQCAYNPHSGTGDYAIQEAVSEADARAKMLIYLLENKLLTP